ncbi:FAD-binding oxidoreductase [Thioflexithrix psekupsensis]|uniref:FAD-binding oxidoreductase n=1 Tax=Thioflexithrix psekupsensis TaxID=1570016 RepID=A0A251X9R7_9GAMM|nr:FAD-binding oxidoreductase [Thioflexithrix psekupsensis]OUD14252.1 FAD-binding oxidoreductase [Thioflexithrix psekupsensis]
MHWTSTYRSWGGFPQAGAYVHPLTWISEELPHSELPLLARGLGRSYGDVCLNDGGILLDTSGLNRLQHFDEQQGLLRCEAGVTLAQILDDIVPRGWFLPTSPGTQFVTVGGAIANDVHGKNHHRAGTFGCHVTQFELLRSNGKRLLCSPDSHPELFRATIGGLGLTGLITWAEIRLRPIVHRAMYTEIIPFSNADEFFDLSQQSDSEYEYTMSWVDCSATGDKLGRGLFMRGNHVTEENKPKKWRATSRQFNMPIELPNWVLNRWSVQAFNSLYYHKQRGVKSAGLSDYVPFFYPLDAILNWNRLYGKTGFLQYQFVLPMSEQKQLRAIMNYIAQTGQGSFLAVLKTFGEVVSPGLLSFPRAGFTLALDFPIHGAKTFALLDRLDEMVIDSGGVIYPAKDARWSGRYFRRCYPQWEVLARYRDSGFSSSFWRRVTQSA